MSSHERQRPLEASIECAINKRHGPAVCRRDDHIATPGHSPSLSRQERSARARGGHTAPSQCCCCREQKEADECSTFVCCLTLTSSLDSCCFGLTLVSTSFRPFSRYVGHEGRCCRTTVPRVGTNDNNNSTMAARRPNGGCSPSPASHLSIFRKWPTHPPTPIFTSSAVPGVSDLFVRFPFFTPFRVVGWGTLALINAGLAESKGRSRYRSSRPPACTPQCSTCH
jgi:hypothetical protein